MGNALMFPLGNKIRQTAQWIDTDESLVSTGEKYPRKLSADS